MPTLRHELKQLSSAPRKLKTKDGQIYDVIYICGHDVSVAATDGHHYDNVVIMNADSPAKAESAIGRVLGNSELSGSNLLAFTKPKVWNQPRLQNLVQSVGRTTRFGMVVEDEPEKITLQHLEKCLKDWIPAFRIRSNSETQRNLHPPYLAIRQRLSDTASGRLNAAKIAALYGLSTAEMGKICGVSKQAIHANPTSKGIQDKLEPLAKAARGLLRFGDDEAKFKAWLNQPNEDFPIYEGRRPSPLDLIRMGHTQVIADKIQNLLTGHPS